MAGIGVQANRSFDTDIHVFSCASHTRHLRAGPLRR